MAGRCQVRTFPRSPVYERSSGLEPNRHTAGYVGSPLTDQKKGEDFGERRQVVLRMLSGRAGCQTVWFTCAANTFISRVATSMSLRLGSR
jgi:hypothetical protein